MYELSVKAMLYVCYPILNDLDRATSLIPGTQGFLLVDYEGDWRPVRNPSEGMAYKASYVSWAQYVDPAGDRFVLGIWRLLSKPPVLGVRRGE